MDEIIPWDEWVSVIEPYSPKGKRGRPPMGIEKMLRMYLLQIWFNLPDSATKDAIYGNYAMRKFTGIDFMMEAVPNETTLCNFRHLLEANGLNKLSFDAINRVMLETEHMMKGGSIVGANIINAPSSTKNTGKARDPEMHQTKIIKIHSTFSRFFMSVKPGKAHVPLIVLVGEPSREETARL